MNRLAAIVMAITSLGSAVCEASPHGYFGYETEPGSFSYEFTGVSGACSLTGPLFGEYTYTCFGNVVSVPFQPPLANPSLGPNLVDIRIKFVNTWAATNDPQYIRYFMHCRQILQNPVPMAFWTPGYICSERVNLKSGFEG